MRGSRRSAFFSLLAGCLGLLAAAFGAYAAKPVTVKDVRLWAGADGTRLVFDLSGPVEHNIMTLDKPDRVRLQNGRRLLLYYDGARLRQVAWRTPRAVYYVTNTLNRRIPNQRLIAIAASLRRLNS